MDSSTLDDSGELAAISKLRRAWSEKLFGRLNSIAAEQGRPLARRRETLNSSSLSSTSLPEGKLSGDILVKPFERLGTAETLRPVYTSTDLRHFLRTFMGPTGNPVSPSSNHSGTSGWNSVALHWGTVPKKEWESRLAVLHPRRRHVGVDDRSHGPSGSGDSGKWAAAAEKRGKKFLESSTRNKSELQQFLQRGSPAGLRGKLWRTFLCDTFDTFPEWIALRRVVTEWESVVTGESLLDIRNTCNDDNFFVFQGFLEELLIPFYFDSYVWEHSLAVTFPPEGVTKDGKRVGIFPPSGVIPFQGMALFAAPLCYLFREPQEAYFVFRELYTRFFSLLHTFTSHPEGLVMQCKHFEDLLIAADPQLFYHMAVTLNFPPLKIVFPWIVSAFSGYLEVEEVLLLWDRIIGFNSVLLVSLLAVAIVLFRKKQILNVTSSQELLQIFHDGSKLRVIPLLQHFLFL